MYKTLQPEGWAKPIGYANGVSARGRTVFVGGQIGWNKDCKFESDDLVDQIGQALENIVSVLACDGGGPEHITTITWYLTDRRDYLARLRQIGETYRRVMGRHFPAMTAVEVSALIEDRAKVEVQATAVIPD
ncbi:RidA family protein [Bradyrhizobium sp. CCBAU 53338]|uniref:RidA family protein n=1 Tax=Bradyrhizobium sp. CCBAU 53338 TaxID=1325111 RepID=UPI00188A697B|nr:RidA family protein [Bradyrhizobium sp. CCBAU 53338]QOZ52569.1 RidA family protein [Bradyrhizobium sp. CCBAU 53338]